MPLGKSTGIRIDAGRGVVVVAASSMLVAVSTQAEGQWWWWPHRRRHPGGSGRIIDVAGRVVVGASLTQVVLDVVVTSVNIDGRVVAASSMQVAVVVIHIVVTSVDTDGT